MGSKTERPGVFHVKHPIGSRKLPNLDSFLVAAVERLASVRTTTPSPCADSLQPHWHSSSIRAQYRSERDPHRPRKRLNLAIIAPRRTEDFHERRKVDVLPTLEIHTRETQIIVVRTTLCPPLRPD